MTATYRVPTRAIQEAVKGREIEVLDELAIDWQMGHPHITCPYPAHEDASPSWRWDDKRARAFCSCIQGSHSIFDVVMAKEEIDFEAAKVRVAELLGCTDLVKPCTSKQHSFLAADSDSLLNAPADQRDDVLPRAYLAYRMSLPVKNVLMPSTPVVGLKELPYHDPPPQGSKAKPKLVGMYPCAVFGTVSADDRTSAHRIYLAPGGAGKAHLGDSPDGYQRDAKKSATVTDGISRAGCAVIWGDTSSADHLFLTEASRRVPQSRTRFVSRSRWGHSPSPLPSPPLALKNSSSIRRPSKLRSALIATRPRSQAARQGRAPARRRRGPLLFITTNA